MCIVRDRSSLMAHYQSIDASSRPEQAAPSLDRARGRPIRPISLADTTSTKT